MRKMFFCAKISSAWAARCLAEHWEGVNCRDWEEISFGFKLCSTQVLFMIIDGKEIEKNSRKWNFRHKLGPLIQVLKYWQAKTIAMSITLLNLVAHQSLSRCMHENLIKNLLFVLVVAEYARSLISLIYKWQRKQKWQRTTHKSGLKISSFAMVSR